MLQSGVYGSTLRVHAHPTLSEAIAEAVLDSMGKTAHLAATALREEPTQQNRWLAGRSLRILGAVAESGGSRRRALMLFGAADAMYEAIGATSLTAERRAVNELPTKLQALMSDAEFTEAWEAGRRLSFREAVAFALEGAEAPSAPVPARPTRVGWETVWSRGLRSMRAPPRLR